MSVARIARSSLSDARMPLRACLLASQTRFLSSSSPLHSKQTAPLQSTTPTSSPKSQITPQVSTIQSTSLKVPAASAGPSEPLLPEFSLRGKNLIVTGGARGLGLTQAEALLEAGAQVYILDRLPEPHENFVKIQEKATELGTKLHYRTIDVRDVAALNVIVEGIADENGGKIDGLLAAAGIQQETPALEYTQADVEKMLSTNVTGTFMTAQAVARQMIKNGHPGSLVFIASMSGSVANKGLICSAYNSSKAAVIQLGRNLAAEWGGHGIRVNTISPGYIVTDMVKALFEQFPARQREWPEQNMLGVLSKPEDYRGAAVFLLSDASRFMTGADLRMDGGHSAW